MLFLAGNHRVFVVPCDLGRRLESGIDSLTPEESREWSALAQNGALDDVHPSRLARSHYSDGANLAINVNLTGACNLACTYCFAAGGDYGRIYRKMDIHTVDYIFEFVRRHVTPSKRVRFEFFGGEPLLNFPVIQEICERSDRVAAETGIKFIYRISTNLTVLPPGAVELFHARNFIVSVSIDGGPKTHNQNRPTKSGKDSFSAILENCRKVRQHGDGIIMVARMTVAASEPSLAANVQELHAENLFDYFQIYPGITARGTATCGDMPASLVQLESFKPNQDTATPPRCSANLDFLRQSAEFIKVYPQLFKNGNRFRGVLEYERIVEMLMKGKLALGFCSGGGTYFTFSPDDSIMPCHRLVGTRQFQIGSGREGLTGDTREWTLPVDAHSVCSGCWARYVCGGNCRQENFLATGDIRGLNEETCRYQRSILEEIIRLLASAPADYLSLPRELDDLFVSCGRPVTSSLRQDKQPEGNPCYFRLLNSAHPAAELM
jgi:radical SAM protein with 4Fe4S-binding SPASM domain